VCEIVGRGASVEIWATVSVTIAQGSILLLVILEMIRLSARVVLRRGSVEGNRATASITTTSVVAASSDGSPSSALLGKWVPQVGLSMELIGGVTIGLGVEMTRRLVSLSTLKASKAFMLEPIIVGLSMELIRGVLRGVAVGLVVERIRRLVSLNTLWARREFQSDLIIVRLWRVESLR
jgi:hypothetical protein